MVGVGRVVRVLACALVAACGSAPDLDSAWSMTATARPADAPGMIARAQAFVDSLTMEGYRVSGTASGATSSPTREFASRGWTLDGRDPQLGPVRVEIAVDENPDAARHVEFRVRFGGQQNDARGVFQDRVIALARSDSGAEGDARLRLRTGDGH